MVGITAAVVVAGTTGFLYLNQEELPGVPPSSETTCPVDHLIKGNRSQGTSTKIYHVPSGAFYDKTTPIRCFATQDEAVGAGYRRAFR